MSNGLFKELKQKREDVRHFKRIEELGDWVSNCLLHLPPVFIVVDALDECEESATRSKIIFFLDRLQKQGVKILLTSRLELSKEFTDVSTLEVQAQSSDINLYIRQTLAGCQRKSEDEIRPEFQDKIVQSVIANAGGMYFTYRFLLICVGFSLPNSNSTIFCASRPLNK
jgi:hypothetical protein